MADSSATFLLVLALTSPVSVAGSAICDAFDILADAQIPGTATSQFVIGFDEVNLLTTGSIRLGTPGFPSTPADGSALNPIMPGYPITEAGTGGALIASWGYLDGTLSEPFVVGTAFSSAIPANVITMEFGINDNFHVDNEGFFTTVCRPSVPVAPTLRVSGVSSGSDFSAGFSTDQSIHVASVPTGSSATALRDAIVTALNERLPGRDVDTQPRLTAGPGPDEFSIEFAAVPLFGGPDENPLCDPRTGGPATSFGLGDGGCLIQVNAAVEALCGNGELDPGEACDDGNIVADDGCNEFCLTEASVPTLSAWGLIVMVGLVLTVGVRVFGRRPGGG